jgi:hypothetical protein
MNRGAPGIITSPLNLPRLWPKLKWTPKLSIHNLSLTRTRLKAAHCATRHSQVAMWTVKGVGLVSKCCLANDIKRQPHHYWSDIEKWFQWDLTLTTYSNQTTWQSRLQARMKFAHRECRWAWKTLKHQRAYTNKLSEWSTYLSIDSQYISASEIFMNYVHRLTQKYSRAIRFWVEKAGFIAFLIRLCSSPVTAKSPKPAVIPNIRRWNFGYSNQSEELFFVLEGHQQQLTRGYWAQSFTRTWCKASGFVMINHSVPNVPIIRKMGPYLWAHLRQGVFNVRGWPNMMCPATDGPGIFRRGEKKKGHSMRRCRMRYATNTTSMDMRGVSWYTAGLSYRIAQSWPVAHWPPEDSVEIWRETRGQLSRACLAYMTWEPLPHYDTKSPYWYMI